MDEDAGPFDAGGVDDRRSPVFEDNGLVSSRPERDRFAVDEVDPVDRPLLFAGEFDESLVIEDVAVLVDLDKGGALMVMGSLQYLRGVGPIHVDRASDERSFGAKGEADGVEGIVDRSHGSRL